MAAGHFFVGLGAGLALLAGPVLLLTPGVPQRFVEWIEGPPPQAVQLISEDAAGSRPLRGYQPGDPTPAPEAVPTIRANVQPTAAPTVSRVARGAAPGQAEAAQVEAAPVGAAQAAGGYLRWGGTGMIRSGGMPVYVRRVAGVDSRDDPQIADGSPVLVGTGPPMQVGAQAWRAVRGLNGVVGWVPSSQLSVDGETGASQGQSRVPSLTPGATPSATAQAGRGRIANTDGSGVVLRNSPNDADRSRAGLMDGASVSLLEQSGSEWVHVRADNGQSGWVPARYVSVG